ncbi:hypothetical protein Tco_0858035 [Tanacetum coccineum]|uniref:Uncharacterized protein n=1 Tax=Tanacetum coccineum TaxID=301880 RepID=A0ABQ5BAY6_9ASTR
MDSNEKQQLFAQKVQQQNTTLTSQLELYKERVRVLENIKGDNNYLNEFLEADKQAKHFNQQAQSQFIRDQNIIRELKQQRDKLDLAVIDYKRQNKEYQKTQTIFNQTRRDKEEKYLNDIIQLQAKVKDLENVNRFKRDVKEMKDVFVSVENDLDETFKQNELLKDQLLGVSLAEDVKNIFITSCMEIRNKDLHDETKRISRESKDVLNESTTADTVCNDAFEVTQELSKRIAELEKDLSKFEAKNIAFEIAL